MADKRTKADLLKEIEILQSLPSGITVQDCTFGGADPTHTEAIVALADAASANARAIEAIANKTQVQIGTGLSFVNGERT